MTPAKAEHAEERTAFAVAAIYGVIHMLVDLATVTATYRAARSLVSPSLLGPFEIVLGYDLVAFGLQLPLGLVADWLKAARAALVAGLVLTVAGLFTISASGVATMVAVGLGNALYHLGAGAIVLSAARGRAGPAGVFVAPGALGLGLGMWFGRYGAAPAWPIAALVALALIAPILLRDHKPSGVQLAPPHKPASDLGRAAWSAVLVLLLISISVRSFVGFAATYQCPKTSMLIILGVPLAGFFGKLVGGILSDRFGWIDASVGALLVSAPLIAYSGGSPYTAVAGLLVFQMTMPVTLTAMYVALPKMPATAFGLPCLALIAGAVPTFYPWGKSLYGGHVFLGMIVVSAIAVYGALAALGMRWGATAIRKGAG